MCGTAGDVLVEDVDLAPLAALTGSDTYQRLTDGLPITAASALLGDGTLRVDDPAAMTQALDDAYDRDDDAPDGTLVWYEHVITHGMHRIRAHIELRAVTNSTSTPTAQPASSASWPPSASWTRQ
ncbi:hypothetical protein BH09ACT7_BH09ACT7_60490 [soil metagenome]